MPEAARSSAMITIEGGSFSRELPFAGESGSRQATFVEEFGNSITLCAYARDSWRYEGFFLTEKKSVIDIDVELFQYGRPLLQRYVRIDDYIPTELVTFLDALTIEVAVWTLRVGVGSKKLDADPNTRHFPDFLKVVVK